MMFAGRKAAFWRLYVQVYLISSVYCCSSMWRMYCKLLYDPYITGGAYMPMDISYPAPLVQDILADSLPTMVCVEPKLAHLLPGKHRQHLI